MTDPVKVVGPIRPLPNLIFASRWLQLPLYIGLIAAQAVYVFHFWLELVHLLEAAFGNQTALQALISSTREVLVTFMRNNFHAKSEGCLVRRRQGAGRQSQAD